MTSSADDAPSHLATRLILVRHGESKTTVARRIGGARTCTGLSPLGVQQAQRLALRWLATDSATESSSEVAADVLISSHYQRARETAALIAPALGDLPVGVDEGWGEHDPGPACDGLSFAEYVERYPDASASWEAPDANADIFPGGGETVAVFHERVADAMDRLLATHAGKTIVVACHGGVVDAVLRVALGAPSVGMFEIHTLNTSITELVHVRPDTWRLIRYNDTAHLAGLPASTPTVPTLAS